jgi:hypothetical protein
MTKAANLSALGTNTSSSGVLEILSGGTGQTTATAAFNALNPMTTVGDIIYEGTGPAAARLPIGTTGQILTVSGGIPSWAANNAATVAYYSATVTTGTWTGSAPSTATITVTGLLSTDKPIVGLDLSGVAFLSVFDVQTAWNNVYRVVATANTLQLFASLTPTQNLPIQIQVTR